MDAMSNFEFVIRNSSDGQLIYRCDTADEARKWRKNSKSLGIDCTIFHQLKDKPSEPKTTPEQAAAAFIDTPERVGECLALWDSMKSKDRQFDPSNCPHFELGYRDGDNRHDCLQCGAQVQISGSTRRIVGVPKTKTNGRNPEFKVGDWVVLDFAVPHLKNHKLIKITADDIGKPYTNNYKHASDEEKAAGHRIDAPTICIEEETPELFESKHCSPRHLSELELKAPTSAAQQQIGGNHYTIELMDKPSEPKMTDAEVAGMFIDVLPKHPDFDRIVAKMVELKEKGIPFTLDADKTSLNYSEQVDKINNPSHYTQGGIECIDAMEAMLSPEEFIGYLRGNIFKYQWRYKDKNGIEDLKKANWYSAKLIERESQ